MKIDNPFNRQAHRFAHRPAADYGIHSFGPRSCDITGATTRGVVGTYPDGSDTIQFADAATSGAGTSFMVPLDWVLGTPIYLKIFLSMGNAGGGNVVMRYNHLEFGENTAAPGAAGTQYQVTHTLLATASVQSVSQSLLQPSVRGQHVRVHFERLGANGSDTYAATMRVLGWAYIYKRDPGVR